MSRIKLSYNGHDADVIFDIETKRVLHYEKDNARIHELYGGKLTYTSVSGLSGEGFVEIRGFNPLTKLQTYRTDAYSCPGEWKDFWQDGEAHIFAPIRSHEGIDHSAPFVVSDGEKVTFCGKSDILRVMRNDAAIEFRTIKIPYLDYHGYKKEIEFKFSNLDGFRGVDASMFVRIPETAKISGCAIGKNHAYKLCNLSEDSLHINRRGLADFRVGEKGQCLYNYVGPVAEGWSAHIGLFYKRNGDQVISFIENAEGDFVILDNLPLVDWFYVPMEERAQDAQKKLVANVEKEKIKREKRADMRASQYLSREEIENAPEFTITIGDVKFFGPCEDGIKEFKNENNIPAEKESLTRQELLDIDPKKLEKMLRERYFATPIFRKLPEISQQELREKSKETLGERRGRRAPRRNRS